MKNVNQQKSIMRKLPDIAFVRKAVSAMKIKMTTKYQIPQDEVSRGESDWAEKVKIGEKYLQKWPGAAKTINAQIDEQFRVLPYYAEMAKDPSKTDELQRIRQDMIFCYFAYGFTANEYFVFRLQNKTQQQRSEFISFRVRQVMRCRMNDLLKADIFNDKTKTYEQYKRFYRREAIAISSPADYEKFHEYVSRHPVFVKKQCFEAQGHSVALVDLSTCGMGERELFDSLIGEGKHIIEERIEQSPEMAVFNESSVNTVRAITFNTRHGFVVPYCMIRTGRPGSFVDNSGAGGVQAEIDFETGTVISDGFDELGGTYAAHPASGTVFKGYQVPDWQQLKELVFECAKQMPRIQFIGWDLAHTKDGWVVVEGNENCYVMALQQIRDKGMRPVFDGIMKDMKLVL